MRPESDRFPLPAQSCAFSSPVYITATHLPASTFAHLELIFYIAATANLLKLGQPYDLLSKPDYD